MIERARNAKDTEGLPGLTEEERSEAERLRVSRAPLLYQLECAAARKAPASGEKETTIMHQKKIEIIIELCMNARNKGVSLEAYQAALLENATGRLKEGYGEYSD